ncbi:MAG: RHS repeat-associated core domain-containing protein [Ktedonobacterales bacterium]
MDLSYNGSVLATALFRPYGVGRYATGTMPTSKGYTGQRQDSGSGLDYDNARYYDVAIGQFTSADSVQGPNRYGYVAGNPETATDPTGKRVVLEQTDSEVTDDSFTTDGGLYVHVHRPPTPDCGVGCAEASSTGAYLGEGELISAGGGDQPIVYMWGDKTNGGRAIGYSGASLAALISALQALAQCQMDGACKQSQNFREAMRAMLTSGVVGLLGLAAIASVCAATGGAGCGAVMLIGGVISAAAAAGASVYLVGELDRFYNLGIDRENAIIAELQADQALGMTAWMTQTFWHGKENPQNGFNFEASFGTTVPDIVIQSIGMQMAVSCANAIRETVSQPQQATSPGLTPGQDSNYAPSTIVAGCTDAR